MRFRLLQAREPGEPVAHEERIAFAERLGAREADVLPFDLLAGATTAQRVCDGVDIVLVGGSGRYGMGDDVPWLAPFVRTMGALAESQFPTFASCFGFQALVVALGAGVRPDPGRAEVGTYELSLTPQGRADPLFGALPETFNAQLGHKDRALALPAPAVHLAASERCPYQALRVGTRVYATQFHPELTEATNRQRFARYAREYGAAAGDAPFAPSPESSDLLRRFVQVVYGSR